MTNIKTSLPKYKKIAEQLISEILNHTYNVGDTLATEKSLCLSHKVSRHTVRDALRYVEQKGLIEKKQGSGSKVIANTMPDTINQVVSSVDDILQHGHDTIFKVTHTENIELSNDLAKLLNAKENETCIRISGIRIEPHDQKPVCFTNIYRLPHSYNHIEENLNDKLSLKSVIKSLETKNIGKVEQTISACLMPAQLADTLNANENSAALKIVRRYFAKNKKELILIAESIYAKNRFSYSSVLYPE
ncbi:GntR family transcriptional regulator [Thalassotalea piscium]